MEIKIAVLADAANVSQENKLNITGIFNRIASSTYPLVWPSMYLVVRLNAHPSEAGMHNLLIRVADEDGLEVARLEAEFELPKPAERGMPIMSQFIVPIRNATFPHSGDYSFDILIDGRYEGSVPLYLRER